MGKLVVTEYVSLDGVFEGPGGGEDFEHAGWTFRIPRGEDGDAFKLEETRATDALLFGRTTFDGMAAVWPHMTGEFADRWNRVPKFVVTSRPVDADWANSHVLGDDLATTVPELVERFDGDVVVHGSGQLVQALLELELVDELRLMTFPVVLGSGRRLFGPSPAPRRMHLSDVRSVGDGIVVSTFTPELSFRVERVLPGDLDTVWTAWTDPVEYGAWFDAVPGSVELDVRPGGRWSLTTRSTDTEEPERLAGEYVEVDPQRRLVMTTEYAGGDTTMTMEFSPVDDRSTRVEISQVCRSRAERDGGREGSLMLLDWCGEHLSRRGAR